MKHLFNFDCWDHQAFKNIAHNGLCELYAISREEQVTPLGLLRLLEHLRCQKHNKQDKVNTADSAFMFLIILLISQNQWLGW